jgi:hypothetical protein
MTGLPTLLGWETLGKWRGNYDEPARREPDIDRLYNTSDVRQGRLCWTNTPSPMFMWGRWSESATHPRD